MDYMFYIAEIQSWDDDAGVEKTFYELYTGDSYADVVEQIDRQWGGYDDIMSMRITSIGESTGPIEINKELAEQLIKEAV